MQHGPLLQSRANGSMWTVFQVQVAVPLHNVCEQVTKERGILGKQRIQVQRALSGGEFSQSNLAGWKARPIGHREPMIWVWTGVSDGLENHVTSIATSGDLLHSTKTDRRQRNPKVEIGEPSLQSSRIHTHKWSLSTHLRWEC